MMTYYRRNLPHWQPPERDIFLTWRLKGSLPSHIRGISSNDDPGKLFRDLDRELDRAAHGPLWLRQPPIAECLLAVLRNLCVQRIADVHAYAVMANHIHVLMTPIAPLAKIARLVKGAAARQANILLGLTGSNFWQDESFDHWIRNPGEWQKIRTYIERNPVAAGLVKDPADWPWSSASYPLK
jgi:REP-associated tyrosine transposase